ncbi:beta-1 adrenergic receptor [Nematostella vectensis]|uniref:beta-1 adrenergic receptor n=1 Tax=Nematostella vectensis TaxID=45351 RepID=UPI0020774A59|nr:beta-1 adrenergic receptor [Nematostella vectensis]
MEATLFLVINCLSLFGNILICYVIIQTNGLRRNTTNVLIVGLAVSDILQALIGMPLTCGVLLTGKWIFGEFLCKVQGFWLLFLGFVSLHSMALTALNRYFCVVRPEVYRRVFTRKSTLFMLCAVWVFALASVTLPQISEQVTFRFQANRAACFITLTEFAENIVYTLYSVICYIALPLCVIVVCYAKVYAVIRHHKKRLRSATEDFTNTLQVPQASQQRNASNNTARHVSVEEIQSTNTLFAIVLGFGSCWIPSILVELVDSALPGGVVPRELYVTYIFLAFLSCAINPVLYSVMSRRFRRATYQALRACCSLKTATNVAPITAESIPRQSPRPKRGSTG